MAFGRLVAYQRGLFLYVSNQTKEAPPFHVISSRYSVHAGTGGSPGLGASAAGFGTCFNQRLCHIIRPDLSVETQGWVEHDLAGAEISEQAR